MEHREPPRTDTYRPVRHAVLLGPIVLAIAAGVSTALIGGPFYLPVASFYGIAAGIIPLLIIALAVETRASEFFKQHTRYRGLLFLFLLAGELFALLGASGTLREPASAFRYELDPAQAASTHFDAGYVASPALLTVIIGGTVIGLVGGFLMIASVAVLGPDVVTRQPSPDRDAEAGTTSAVGGRWRRLIDRERALYSRNQWDIFGKRGLR